MTRTPSGIKINKVRPQGSSFPPASADPGTSGIRSGTQGSSFPPASADPGTSGIRSGTQVSSFPPASGDPGTSGIRSGTKGSSCPPASGPRHIGDQIRYTELILPSSQWTLAYRGSDQVQRALPSHQPAGSGTSGIRSGTQGSSIPPSSGPWHTRDQIRYTGLFLPSSQRALACRDQIGYTELFLPSSHQVLAYGGSYQVHRSLPSLQPTGSRILGIRSGTQGSSIPPASGPWHTRDQIRYRALPFLQPTGPGSSDQIRYTGLFLPSSQEYRGSDQVHRVFPSLQPADPGTWGIRSGTQGSSFSPASRPRHRIRSGTQSFCIPLASGRWHIGDQIRYTGLFLSSSRWALEYRGVGGRLQS
jgi:hypothetical protein